MTFPHMHNMPHSPANRSEHGARHSEGYPHAVRLVSLALVLHPLSLFVKEAASPQDLGQARGHSQEGRSRGEEVDTLPTPLQPHPLFIQVAVPLV
jgi:hypothetical protein